MSADSYEKTCGCGAKILMVKVDGKTIPLDRSSDVYRPGSALLGEDPESWQRVYGGGVNHFKTCPSAEDYTRTKKSTKEGQ